MKESNFRDADTIADSLRRSLDQVKQIEAGQIPPRSAISFIEELRYGYNPQ